MAEQKIFGALVRAQKAIGAVGKDGNNAFDKYRYRTIDDVMNAAHKAFVEAGIVVVPKVLEKEQMTRQSKKGDTMIHTTLKVEYTFYAEDGSSVSAVAMGEGMDRGDKSINKAMSGAYKYALFQTLAIPTEEMVDSETESPEIAAEIITDGQIKILQAQAEVAGSRMEDIIAAYVPGKTANDMTPAMYADALRKLKVKAERQAM